MTHPNIDLDMSSYNQWLGYTRKIHCREKTCPAMLNVEMVMQVAVAGLDCNRSEVVQECLERLVGENSRIISSVLP